MPSPDLVAEQNSLGRSESEARRDKAFEAMREALMELSAMYTHAWDLVEGGLVMTQSSMPRFENAHAAAVAALALAEKAKT